MDVRATKPFYTTEKSVSIMNMKQMFGSENAYRMKTTKTMTCQCGAVMRQGTGQFATDYKCDRCGKMFNSAGSEVRWVESNFD